MFAYNAELAQILPLTPDSEMRSCVNMCWSPEGQWCVSTDIDLNTTVVGASEDIAAQILESKALEAYRVSPQQRLTWDTDKLNPLPRPPD